MKSCHISRNIIHSSCRLNNFKSPFTHSLRILPPQQSTYLQADTQSSTPIRSRCPNKWNHLNLPCLTTSATLWIPKRLYKSSLRFLSCKYTRHTFLSPSNAPPFPDCRFSAINAYVSVPYVNTLWALHISTILKYLLVFLQSIIQCMQAH